MPLAAPRLVEFAPLASVGATHRKADQPRDDDGRYATTDGNGATHAEHDAAIASAFRDHEKTSLAVLAAAHQLAIGKGTREAVEAAVTERTAASQRTKEALHAHPDIESAQRQLSAYQKRILPSRLDPAYRQVAKTSADADAWGKKHFGAWQKSLSAKEKAALTRYTEDGFLETNASLRKGNVLDAKSEVHAIDHALSKSPGAPEPLLVYRGMTGEHVAHIKAGDSMTDRAFASCSLRRDAGAMRALGGAVLEIQVPKGGPGAYMVGAANTAESEYLLPRNARMRVLAVSGDNAMKVIRCQLETD